MTLRYEYGKKTYIDSLDLATVMTDSLEDLLDLVHEAVVIDGLGELDDTKVADTLLHVLFASGASEVAIDGSEMRIVRTFLTRSDALLIPVCRLESVIRGRHRQETYDSTYIVSGYSMLMTARRSDSSWEKRPN
jgi:hypothetical protein